MSNPLESLRLFALAMLEAWPLGDVDGGTLQNEAVKHGLLVPQTRTAPCSEEGCNCAEYYGADEWAGGIICYRRAAWLKRPDIPTVGISVGTGTGSASS